MKRLYIVLAIGAFLLFATGCHKDSVQPEYHVTVVYHGNGGVIFNGNSGDSTNTVSTYKDVHLAYSVQVKQNMFTNGYKTFLRWNTRADGSGYTHYPDEYLYHQNAEYHLYAIWQTPNSNINMCNGSRTLQNGETCYFYDSGGAGSNYSNYEDYTYTFYAQSGKRVKITFTSFNTESSYDYLTINGINYSGTNSPGTKYSTGSYMTIRFHSDGGVTKTGWAATVTTVY